MQQIRRHYFLYNQVLSVSRAHGFKAFHSLVTHIHSFPWVTQVVVFLHKDSLGWQEHKSRNHWMLSTFQMYLSIYIYILFYFILQIFSWFSKAKCWKIQKCIPLTVTWTAFKNNCPAATQRDMSLISHSASFPQNCSSSRPTDPCLDVPTSTRWVQVKVSIWRRQGQRQRCHVGVTDTFQTSCSAMAIWG